MKQASFEILAQVPEKLESHASVFGDHVMWLRFVFTDDQANHNKQGVPRTEFANIIRTGKLKPFKKLSGGVIGPDHEGAIPIGAIASLEEVDNTIEAIAAVWEKEFPEDADQIRETHAAGQSLNVSWELWYQDEEVDDDGVAWLKDITTRAVTMVDNPAYAGRTPILAVAANKKGEAEAEAESAERPTLDEELKEGDSSMELEELKAQLKVKEEELDKVTVERDEAKSSLDELKGELKELEDLRQFKEQVEADRARQELLDKRFGSFAEAGIEMERDAFEAEADRWLGMDDEAFSFVLKMMVNTPGKSEASASSAPPMTDGNESQEDEETGEPMETFRSFLEERREAKDKKES